MWSEATAASVSVSLNCDRPIPCPPAV